MRKNNDWHLIKYQILNVSKWWNTKAIYRKLISMISSELKHFTWCQHVFCISSSLLYMPFSFLFNDISINSANNRIIWCCRRPIWCNLNWNCFQSFSTLTIAQLWFDFDSHTPFNGTINTFLTIENYLQRNVSIKFTKDNNKWNISSERLLNFIEVFNFWHFFGLKHQCALCTVQIIKAKMQELYAFLTFCRILRLFNNCLLI